MVLLRFLFDFALPWLAVRQGIRCNSSDTLDRMWSITLAWFRACGKTNYAPMAIDVLFVNTQVAHSLPLSLTFGESSERCHYAATLVATLHMMEAASR